ncbi:MAG: hypothetical protein M0P57_08865 [Syntrophales bacterium]|nr:hypothetical protein [Syntrophales bacterium]MDY0044866.1 hypothetical protein [Syntrophales bacterium]
MEERKRKVCLRILFALLALVFMPGGAAAQDEARLVLKTDVAKEIKVKEGTAWIIKYEPVTTTKPGDILRYTIAYHNEGNAPAVGARIVDPVPKGTVYIIGSATGTGTDIEFSVDGGVSWQSPPVMHAVRKPGGGEKQEPAPPELFTHIKWSITKEVPAGHSDQVFFKVTVQ